MRGGIPLLRSPPPKTRCRVAWGPKPMGVQAFRVVADRRAGIAPPIAADHHTVPAHPLPHLLTRYGEEGVPAGWPGRGASTAIPAMYVPRVRSHRPSTLGRCAFLVHVRIAGARLPPGQENDVF